MSDLVTELRKIAATLPANGQIHTLLYAADLIGEITSQRDELARQLGIGPEWTADDA